jgi:NADPH-dependent curcumin reductase CurA
MTGLPSRQQVVELARSLTGVPVAEDFRVSERPVPPRPRGGLLLRTLYLSLDPYLRSAMAGRHLGHAPTAIGEIPPGRAIAEVVESAHPTIVAGALVIAETGWQEFAASDGRGVTVITDRRSPLSAHLGVLGMPGLTGWTGVTQLIQPKSGETMVVSAPVGAVGSVAGQVAKIHGCRVIGVSGSAEKCRLAVEEFGFDVCVSYRDADWRDRLRAACPDGIHGYFDNTGGDVLEAVMVNLRPYGTVALCGLIDQYNTGVPYKLSVASIIGKRAQMKGLVVYDFADRQAEYTRLAAEWLADGRLRYREDRAFGLADAPVAFCRLMRGANIGKAVVVVGPEPGR